MLSRVFTPKEQLLLFAVILAVAFGVVGLYMYHENNDTQEEFVPIEPKNATPAFVSEPILSDVSHSIVPSEPEMICVSVTGAVRKPGVYDLAQGDRVHDAVNEAGGFHDDAYTLDINLAAQLIDGTTLFVPRLVVATDIFGRTYRTTDLPAVDMNPSDYTIMGSREKPSKTAQSGASGTGLININTASSEELQKLPGIGPALAGRIIDLRRQRPFLVVDDLTNVSGIGPKTLESVRDMVTVR